MDLSFQDIGWLSCLLGASNDQIKDLLKAYLERDPTIAEFEKTLHCKRVTTFLVATIWIGRQPEKDPRVLDALLARPIKPASEYLKEGITTGEIAEKKGLELTLYSLGWLTEYLNHQKQREQ